MKAISDYSIFCTEKQTKKALELGAPIITFPYYGVLEDEEEYFVMGNVAYVYPTAEQMIGWLEEQEGIKDIAIAKPFHWVFLIGDGICYHSTGEGFKTRKEVTLAAIDAALDYLIKNKK